VISDMQRLRKHLLTYLLTCSSLTTIKLQNQQPMMCEAQLAAWLIFMMMNE